jgi:hypothetical protein
VALAVLQEVGIGDPQVRVGKTVGGAGELALELDEADLGRVLIAQAVGDEGLRRNRESEAPRIISDSLHEKGVLPSLPLGSKTYVLDLGYHEADPLKKLVEGPAGALAACSVTNNNTLGGALAGGVVEALE